MPLFPIAGQKLGFPVYNGAAEFATDINTIIGQKAPSNIEFQAHTDELALHTQQIAYLNYVVDIMFTALRSHGWV